MFEGQYSRKDDKESFVTIKADIVFMGKDLSMEFTLDLTDITKGAKALMESLLEDVGDLSFVPDNVDKISQGTLLYIIPAV